MNTDGENEERIIQKSGCRTERGGKRERGRERDIGMVGKRECCIINPSAS